MPYVAPPAAPIPPVFLPASHRHPSPLPTTLPHTPPAAPRQVFTWAKHEPGQRLNAVPLYAVVGAMDPSRLAPTTKQGARSSLACKSHASGAAGPLGVASQAAPSPRGGSFAGPGSFAGSAAAASCGARSVIASGSVPLGSSIGRGSVALGGGGAGGWGGSVGGGPA
jgi:hypothetical protein